MSTAAESDAVASEAFTSYKNLDLGKIAFGQPVKNRMNAGAKMISVQYAGSPMYVRFPKMYLSTVFQCKDNPNKFSLNVSFRDMEEKESIREVHRLLNAIDDRIMDEAVANGMLWFRQSVTRESLQLPHTRTIKKPTDPKYSDSFRPTIYSRDDGSVNADVFDESGNPCKDFKIDKAVNCDVVLLLQCSSVYLINGKFGLSWRVVKMRVYPRAKMQSMRIEPTDAIRPQDVSIAGLTFSAPRNMTSGSGKIVLVSHNNKPLVIRTPKMLCPWGVQVFPDKPDAKPTMELSFKEAEVDQDVGFFKEVLQAFDARVKSEMDKGGWFRAPGAPTPTYGSVLHQPNPAYAPVLKASFLLEHGQITAPIKTANGVPFGNHELDRRLKNAVVSAVIQCTSIWANGDKCGASWRVLEVVAQPAPSAIDCKMDASDDEDAGEGCGGEEEVAEGGDEQSAAVPDVPPNYIADSDDDV